MEIKVLGSGCTKCKTLMNLVSDAVKELGITANIEKVEDINKIIGYGVMSTPALVINGKVVVSGRLPKPEEIKKILQGG